MGFSNWTHLDGVDITGETAKALLLRIGKKELWVPKSVVSDSGDYSVGDRNVSISIQDWFAEKEGLGYA